MSKPVRACCWFLYHFGKLNSQNKFALFDHFDFLVSSSHSHPGKGRTNGRMCIQYMLIRIYELQMYGLYHVAELCRDYVVTGPEVCTSNIYIY